LFNYQARGQFLGTLEAGKEVNCMCMSFLSICGVELASKLVSNSALGNFTDPYEAFPVSAITINNKLYFI